MAAEVVAVRYAAMQGILRRRGGALFEAAATAGFAGVELDVGAEDDPLLTASGLDEAAAAMAATGLAVPSICLGCLNGFGFKDPDPAVRARATALIHRAVAACSRLGARVILVPFFGHSELMSANDADRAAEGLAAVAPEAERAGVVLAVENTLSAARNLDIMRAAGSPAVKVYFDVSNAQWWGHDSPSEIRRLGAAMAQIHFKDGRGDHSNAALGEGHVDFPAVARALGDIGYDGWIVLESASPGDPVEDARANLAFAKALMASVGRATRADMT